MHPILAASEFEIVVGIIVFIIWGISSLLGNLKKPRGTAGDGGDETTLERMRRETIERLREMGHPVPPQQPPMRQAPSTPQSPSRQTPSARQTPPQRQVPPVRQAPRTGSQPGMTDFQRRQQKDQARSNTLRKPTAAKSKKAAKRAAPFPPPIPGYAEAVAVPNAASAASGSLSAAAPSVARDVAPPVNAAVIAQWMKPGTLRQQFILTEIFQPPKSMRES